MIIYIGADHRGFYLKETLKTTLKADGYEVYDLGNVESDENDDYPDFASAVAEKVTGAGAEVRGIVICSSGIGVNIVANKIPGVRCGLAISADQVRHGRSADDMNVLALASEYTSPEAAKDMVRAFLSTPFDREVRRVRRLDKIAKIEKEH